MKYTIYQLPIENDLVFMNFEFATNHGGVHISNYEKVYSGEIKLTEKNVTDKIGYALEELFEKFNIDIPEDFTERSLSVSDIVVMDGIGTYFCDSIGWKRIA
jgi:hypothetical protein